MDSETRKFELSEGEPNWRESNESTKLQYRGGQLFHIQWEVPLTCLVFFFNPIAYHHLRLHRHRQIGQPLPFRHPLVHILAGQPTWHPAVLA